MKRILILLALFAFAASNLAWADTLYREDFESYEVGTQMGEQEGWGFYSTYNGNTTVVTNAPNIEGKAMFLSQSSSGSDEYVMVLTPSVDLTTPNAAANLVTVSAKVIMGSNTDLFAIYDKSMNRYFYLKGNRADGILDSYPSGVVFSNLFTDAATPNEISFVWDPFEQKVLKVSCNGEEQECNILPSGSSEQPSRLRLSVQLGSLDGAEGTYYDYVDVSYSPRSADPMLYCPEDALIPLDAESVEFEIYNAGPDTTTINYSITTSGDWLSVTPDSGSFNESATLTLKAREGLEEGFYRGTMTVDGGDAGTKVVSVMCSNGNVIFEENFDDMTPGNIVGQRGWTVDVGAVSVTNAYDCAGNCMFMHRCGGSYACSMYLPKPWYENIIVKVSYDLYWPSDSNCDDSYVLMKDNGVNEKFEGQFMPTYPDGLGMYMIKRSNKDGSEQTKRVKDFPLSPFDTWNRVEYCLDLQSQKLLYFSVGENVTNFVDWPLMNQGCNFFNSWGHSAWNGEDNGSRVAVDNLKIERIPREADPELVTIKYDSFGTGDTITLPIRNGGAGSFDYTAEVLDLDDALTVTNPSGTVTDSVDLVITIDRSGLEDNFYRTRVRIDAGEAGCATSIASFVCGNVYYFADFEEPFFTLGNFAGQDQWEDDNGGENIAYICSTNDQQSLYMEYGGNYGGYMHALDVPANQLVKFEMDVFIPPEIFDDPEWMDQNLIYLKQNSKYTASKELMLRATSVDGVPYVYATAKDYDMPFCETEYANEWMHVSYVIDYLEGYVTEFTIDDNTFTTDELITTDAGVPCTLFCICGSYGANLTFDNVKVSVVPEPAALVALIALLALGIRRR